MSNTLASEPAVVLRSNYVHVRAMLLAALAAIVGLTIAVVLLASNNSSSSTPGTAATHANSAATSAAAIHANAAASREIGAKLDHSGRKVLISGGSDFGGARATFYGPQQLRADYPGHR